MIHQVANFANEVLAAGLSRLTGRFDDFHRFFDDFGPNRLDAAGQQLARVRLFARLRGPIGDRPFQFVDGSWTGAHAILCFRPESAGYINIPGIILILTPPGRKRTNGKRGESARSIQANVVFMDTTLLLTIPPPAF